MGQVDLIERMTGKRMETLFGTEYNKLNQYPSNSARTPFKLGRIKRVFGKLGYLFAIATRKKQQKN